MGDGKMKSDKDIYRKAVMKILGLNMLPDEKRKVTRWIDFEYKKMKEVKK